MKEEGAEDGDGVAGTDLNGTGHRRWVATRTWSREDANDRRQVGNLSYEARRVPCLLMTGLPCGKWGRLKTDPTMVLWQFCMR